MVNRRKFIRAAGLGAAAALTHFPALAASETLPIVTLASGKLSGYRCRNILVFKGIPFGADTRTTRFQAPRPASSWQGMRACTEWPSRAPQQSPDPPRPDPVAAGINILEGAPEHLHLPPDEGLQSEDCLHLNFWTPGLRPSATEHPVLVYIHGERHAHRLRSLPAIPTFPAFRNGLPTALETGLLCSSTAPPPSSTIPAARNAR